MSDESKKTLIFDTTTFEAVGTEEEKGTNENEKETSHSDLTSEFSVPQGGFSLGVGFDSTATNIDAGEEKPKKKKEPKKEKVKAKKEPETTAVSLRQNKNDVEKKKKKQKKSVRFKRLSALGVPINEYFVAFSRKYLVLMIICYVLAAVFAGSCFAAFGSITVSGEGVNKLSIENFKYLLKDLDFSSLSTGSFDSMVYSGGSDAKFGVYRGDLIVVNTGTTSLYKSSGAFSFTSENEFYDPQLVVSDKYFLVYDVGNTSYGYAIYNSFMELKTETYSYPITGGTVCDSGTYALVTRDENYRSIIKVYDSNLNSILQVKKEKYNVAIDLSNDGKYLYTASLFDSDGDYSSEVSVIDIEKGEELFSAIIEDAVPMNVKALNNGNIAVMYTDRIVVYSNDGISVGEISLSSSTALASGYLGGDVICMMYNNSVIGNEKNVEIYDAECKLIYSTKVSGELLKIKSYDGEIYILFQDRAVKISPKNKKEYVASTQPNGIDIEFSSNGTSYICYSGSALSLDFKEINE